jgi:ribose 5-phosphate isomerase B
MRVALAADHGGYPLKQHLLAVLDASGHEILDLGTDSAQPVDYPDYARAIASALLNGEAERGILICGSGAGAAIAANKVRGIRAGLAHDTYTARQMVEHDDVNVCCLGARVIGVALAEEVVAAFLAARFTGEERHVRRLAKVQAIEEEGLP